MIAYARHVPLSRPLLLTLQITLKHTTTKSLGKVDRGEGWHRSRLLAYAKEGKDDQFDWNVKTTTAKWIVNDDA